MTKNLLSYFITAAIFISLIWIIVNKGAALSFNQTTVAQTEQQTINETSTQTISQQNLTHQFLQNIHHPLSLLLLQIIVILFVSKIFGIIFTKFGQSAVVGEIIAGIFLGPSVLGYFFPQLSGFIFSADSIKNLQFLSQIGLMFFMFVVGMDVDMDALKHKVQRAVVISHSSILFSFFLGVSLSWFIYDDFAPANVPFIAFALFMGIAMSITAFPVLARILKDRNLTHTPLGVPANVV